MPLPGPAKARPYGAVEHEAHIALRAWGLLALDAPETFGGRLADLIMDGFPTHTVSQAGRVVSTDSTSRWRWLIGDVEGGRAQSAALQHEGVTQVAAVVDAATSSVITARRSDGIYLDPPGRRVVFERADEAAPLRLFLKMAVDGRSPELLTLLAQIRTGAPMTTRIMGSAAIALAEAALAGGTFVGLGLRSWQFAAGVLFAEEAGLVVRSWSDAGGVMVVAAPSAQMDVIAAALSR